MKRLISFSVAVLCSLGLLLNGASAGETVSPEQKKLDEIQQKGINFLKTTQAEDGSWTTSRTVGVTALVVAALLESGLSPDEETVAAGLKQILDNVRDDGGIYAAQSGHRNYETCICVMALAQANEDGRYQKQIDAAAKYLRNLQADDGEGLESSDVNYGGAGYTSQTRPDLSNTQYLLEALKDAGAKDDDPALQKALIFVSRCQNLETEHNTTPFAAKVNDGGFYYTPAGKGSSAAGTTPEGGLRSYGSMTYAGLKSMVYAGLTMDDPRVKAAYDWICKFYTVKEQPGMGQNGVYYYYHTLAKTLDVMGIDEVVDAQGNKHDWRKDLITQLASVQRDNGSWVNDESERWYEGDPNLATAFALLSLSHCETAPDQE